MTRYKIVVITGYSGNQPRDIERGMTAQWIARHLFNGSARALKDAYRQLVRMEETGQPIAVVIHEAWAREARTYDLKHVVLDAPGVTA